MANMDLLQINSDALAFGGECQTFIQGLEDMANNTNLSPDEVRMLLQLRDQYITFRDIANRLGARAQDLLSLGYPTLPTITIPAEFKQKLQDGLTAEGQALGLITGVENVVGGTITFSDAVEKKP